MQALKLMKIVKNGKASVDIPDEFGDKVEIIILPVKHKEHKKDTSSRKTILDIVGKAKIAKGIFTKLENGRKDKKTLKEIIEITIVKNPMQSAAQTKIL
jgi:hypothetical protein